MARSNHVALTGIVGHSLTYLDIPSEPSAGSFLSTYLPHHDAQPDVVELASHYTQTHSLTQDRCHSHALMDGSESVLTGMQSGHFSLCSWGVEEGEFDRATTERVGRMFDRINTALYEGRSSGSEQLDRECGQWRDTFPHLQVQGEHLLDAMDDGTELVPPLDLLPGNSGREEREEANSTWPLIVVGKRLVPKVLSEGPENDALREEVIAAHGILEDYFAFDDTDYCPTEHKHPPKPHPYSCLREMVFRGVLEEVWKEVAVVLFPLATAMKNTVIREHSSSYSLTPSLPTLPPSLPSSHHSHSPLPPHPLLQAGGMERPAPATAGQGRTQYLHEKTSAGFIATPLPCPLPHLLLHPSCLEGVMQIKSVSLKHRIPLLAMEPHDEEEEDLSLRPPPSLPPHLSRPTPSLLLPRQSDCPPPPTPAGLRLLSGRIPRRPALRPLDKPPPLVAIDDGIRGHRLSTTFQPVSPHPPPTTSSSYPRNTHLPPLEGGGVSTTGVFPQVQGLQGSNLEQSTPVVRGKTLSSRNLIASSELVEARRAMCYGRVYGELRPNTSTSSSRVESGKLGRKVPEHSYFPRSAMKIVGHAATAHNTVAEHMSATLRERGGGGGGGLRLGGSIAEGEEQEDAEEEGQEEGDQIAEVVGAGLNITGYSGFRQPKPKNDIRGKLRGHVVR